MKRQHLLFLLTPLIALSIFYIRDNRSKALISPVLGVSKINISNNVWLPKLLLEDNSSDLDISAKAAIFIDTKTGQVLYQKNPNERLPIASLTKLMTVVVALENGGFDKNFTISKTAADMEPDKMQLIAGEKLTMEELLDGVFSVSANDAAEELAEYSTGSRDEFISLMNKKASALGMNDTLFINPTGLEEDGKDQYSSALDVALMSRYLISHFPHVVDISSQYHIYLPQSDTHQDYDLYSGINLITTYPGVVGLKTGYTPSAGLTLVTLARVGGHEVMGVLLGSGDRRDEARSLLDYSFKKLGVDVK